MGKYAGSVGNQGFVFTPGMGPPRPSQLETPNEKRQKAKRQAIIKAEWDEKEAQRIAEEEIGYIVRRFLPRTQDTLLKREQRELIEKRKMNAVQRLAVWQSILQSAQSFPKHKQLTLLRPEHVIDQD